MGRRAAQCPVCGSLERHRLIWLYLRARTDVGGRRPLSILHVAPDAALESALRRRPGYVSGDLHEGRGDLDLDLTALPFQDATFDLVLAIHVLEHIPDDAAALSEIARVLKPGGQAVLQVPWRRGPTIEDPSVASPQERRERFGQEDHVRWYGDDFADRVRAAGLHCELEVFRDEIPGRDRARYGLVYLDAPDPLDDLHWTIARASRPHQ